VRIFPFPPGPGPQRTLAEGQIDAYELDLPADTYLHATFEQHGVDVAVEVFAPGHRRWMRVDTPNGTEGPEEIHLLTEAAGRYRLEVTALRVLSGGTYRPALQAVRPPTEGERRRAGADRAFHEARELEGRGGGFWEEVTTYEKALRLYTEAGDRWHEAYSCFRLGRLHLSHGRHREALDLFSRAAPLFDSVHDGHFLGASRGEIGTCYLGLADFDRALSAYQEALALQRRRDDVKEQAVLLLNLGNLFQLQGRSSEALAAFRESLGLYEKLGNRARSGAANALTGIGWVYDSLGDSQRAVEAHFRALLLRNRLGDDSQRAISLTQVGNAFLALDPERGLPFFERALALERKGGYLPEQRVTLNDVGIALSKLGRYGEARATYLEALKLYGSPADPEGQAAAWINLGWSAVHLDRPGDALEAFGRGLRLARERHDPSREARALLGMAEAERERGNLILAEERAEASLRLFETLRTAVVRSDLQVSYLAANENVYAILIRILMERHRAQPGSGFALQAFARSEQARARVLLDSLRESRSERIDLVSGVAPELYARRRRRLAEIGALDAQRGRPGAPATERAAAERALSERLDELGEVDAEIRRRAGKAPSPPDFSPTAVAELRRRLLDRDTVLLEYYLAGSQSYLWLVSADRFESFELPGNEILEPLLRASYVQLSGGSEPAAGPDRMPELARLLLGPVARELRGKRLLIAADAAAQWIPFAALPDPGAGGAPLAQWHEVLSIPSLAVLAELRERGASRQRPENTLALLGDPVFDPADERLPPDAAARAGGKTAGAFLPRLTRSREEVQGIAALLPAAEVREALDLDASRELVMSGALAGYRYLHFATHGLLRTDHPELSALVLSRFDRRGEPHDGSLRVPDVAGLDLPADLVVLSACSTALGRETAGEGLVGLPQAFFTAGAQRVLVSLWQVEDESTAALMRHFYRRLLVDRVPPARALRDAQLAIRGQARWRSPRYWAGFVLQGDF
jgi:CHAT domain-containing protein/tetratricopeptide (TPR) repeat protein